MRRQTGSTRTTTPTATIATPGLQPADSVIPADTLTPRQAARLVSTHISTVYRWVLVGRVRAWKIGGTRYRVSRADVLAAVKLVEPVGPIPEEVERERGRREATEQLRAAGWKV